MRKVISIDDIRKKHNIHASGYLGDLIVYRNETHRFFFKLKNETLVYIGKDKIPSKFKGQRLKQQKKK